MTEKVKIVVFVPEAQVDAVLEAIGNAGAGKIGNYSHCSFSVKGIGRFLPLDGSNPAIGQIGKFEEVIEERLEFVCDKNHLENVIKAMKKTHPYEEVAYDIYPLL